jgi:hypothetical protein
MIASSLGIEWKTLRNDFKFDLLALHRQLGAAVKKYFVGAVALGSPCVCHLDVQSFVPALLSLLIGASYISRHERA